MPEKPSGYEHQKPVFQSTEGKTVIPHSKKKENIPAPDISDAITEEFVYNPDTNEVSRDTETPAKE